MHICQLTDLHVRPRGLASNRVSETNMLTERAFRVVARLDPLPDVVIITGDLTECGLAPEYANLSEMLGRTLSMPVYFEPASPTCPASTATRISSSTRSRIIPFAWSCWTRW
jgi:3',5'-cyclic-AMP phosphodiesterase